MNTAGIAATAYADARIIGYFILPDSPMLVHPQFDPVATALRPSSRIHWYGLMYLAGFLTFLWLGRKRIAILNNPQINTKLLDDLLFYGVLGVILGGRLGYVLFYKAAYYFRPST